MKRKILSIFLAICVMASVFMTGMTAMADDVSTYGVDVAVAGTEITVTIAVPGNAGIAAGNMTLVYNKDKMAFSNKEVVGPGYIYVNENYANVPNSVRVVFGNAVALKDDTELAILTFTRQNGTVSADDFSFPDYLLFGEEKNEVICSSDQALIIPSFTCDHIFGEWIVDEPVTCVMYGHRYRVCSVCGETEEGFIEPTGHVPGEVIMTKEPTCTEWGSSERRCTVCGDVLEFADYPPLGHSFGEWIVDKEPTATESGSQHRVCSVCGYKEQQTLAPIQIRTKAQVMVSSLYVMSGPSSSSATVVQLVKDNMAYIDGENGNWYKVSFTKGGKQYSGYLLKQYVKIISGTPKDKGAVIAKNANVYTSTAATKVESKLNKGLQVYLDGTAGNYYLVSFSLKGSWHYGYVLKDYVRNSSLPADYKSEPNDHQATVMASEVIVRDAQGNPVTVLYKNNKVYINEVLDNGEYKVSFTQGGKPYAGYAGKQYFRIASGTPKDKGAIIAKSANVYTSTAAAKVESTLSRNLLIYIDQEVGDYYLVSFSLKGSWHYGYVKKDYVRNSSLPSDYTVTPDSHQATVMTNEVIVRDADGNPVTVLYKNNKVYINEVLGNGTYKVSFTQGGAAYAGYVGKQYFKVSAGEAKPTGTVTAKVATVYTDRAMTEMESTLAEGLRVYIDANLGDCYLVSFSLKGVWHYGYMSAAALRV